MTQNEPANSTPPRRILCDILAKGEDVAALLTSQPQAMLLGDHLGIVRANDLALRLFDADPLPPEGASYETLTARSRLVHCSGGRHLTRGEQPYAQALLGRSATCDASLNDPPTGRQLALRCLGAPIRSGGVHMGALVVYHDVSDITRTSEVLSRSIEELREFSAIVAHDLKEPLRMIAIFLERLGMRDCIQRDEQAGHFLRYAAESAQRMQNLIEDLLELTRVGQQQLQRTRVDCETAVAEAVGLLRNMLQERQGEVIVGEMPVVYADRSHLVRLFLNLIGNALKYCREDVPPRIEVTAERRERDMLFTVRDNGIGISPEDSQRIFAPFDRLGRKAGAPGSGLGLSICRRIIARHRGDIWVESAGAGRGSAFRFTIPHPSEEGALEARGRAAHP